MKLLFISCSAALAVGTATFVGGMSKQLYSYLLHISDCNSLPHMCQTDNFLVRKDLVLYTEAGRNPKTFSPVASMYHLLPPTCNT